MVDSAAHSAPALHVEGLRKRYGARVAVDGVSFHVRAGEVFGLLGPNGAGKTTTLHMLASLLEPDEGRVEICGVDLARDVRRARARLGLVPQELALYETLSARENLRAFGSVYGLCGRALTARIDEVLAVVGLANRARDAVSTLSGGMQRRLNLAAALLHEPAVLLLDEPTVGVDPQSRSFLLAHLEALRARGTAIVFSTHYMEEAERVCDRLAIVDGGRIIAEGTRGQLLARLGRGHAWVSFALVDAALDAASVPLGAEVLEAFGRMPAAVRVALEGEGMRVDVLDSGALFGQLTEVAARQGLRIRALTLSPPTLETLFLALTGHHFRDE